MDVLPTQTSSAIINILNFNTFLIGVISVTSNFIGKYIHESNWVIFVVQFLIFVFQILIFVFSNIG